MCSSDLSTSFSRNAKPYFLIRSVGMPLAGRKVSYRSSSIWPGAVCTVSFRQPWNKSPRFAYSREKNCCIMLMFRGFLNRLGRVIKVTTSGFKCIMILVSSGFSAMEIITQFNRTVYMNLHRCDRPYSLPSGNGCGKITQSDVPQQSDTDNQYYAYYSEKSFSMAAAMHWHASCGLITSAVGIILLKRTLCRIS